ncbi:hypothetical protein LINPERHAP2_LOCUS19803 [Linum perenne]
MLGFFTLLLLLLLLCGAVVPTQSRRLESKVVVGCWNEIYQVHNSFFNTIKAFFSKGSIKDVGVPWCKDFLSLTGNSQVAPTLKADVADLKWTSSYPWPHWRFPGRIHTEC